MCNYIFSLFIVIYDWTLFNFTIISFFFFSLSLCSFFIQRQLLTGVKCITKSERKIQIHKFNRHEHFHFLTHYYFASFAREPVSIFILNEIRRASIYWDIKRWFLFVYAWSMHELFSQILFDTKKKRTWRVHSNGKYRIIRHIFLHTFKLLLFCCFFLSQMKNCQSEFRVYETLFPSTKTKILNMEFCCCYSFG